MPRGDGEGRKIVADRELSGGVGLGSSTTAIPTNMDASLDVVIDNNGSTNHTLTITPRGASSKTFSAGLPAFSSAWIPVEGIQSIALDTTDVNVFARWGPRGSVKPFFKGATGAGVATSVATTELGTFSNNNAGAAFQQAGFGTTLKITPLRSGVVLLLLWGTFEGGAGGTLAQIKSSFGTGTAPAAHAAVTGTVAGPQLFQGTLGAGADQPFSIAVVISGLTVGTAYWFDAQINTNANTIAVDVWGSVSELPA